MPKVLITGATGLLGREIVRTFRKASWNVIGTGFRRGGSDLVTLDLTNQEAVRELIEKEKPSIIIHSAAERSPDAVASQPDAARALNVTATSSLVTTASSHQIPVLYISTDYVFPGIAGEAPYSETSSIPRPTNLYGQLKLDGERAVLDAADTSKPGDVALGGILRVPVLYGPIDPDKGNAESAINVLVDKVRDAYQATGDKITMDHWQRRYPTYTGDVAAVTLLIAARWLAMLDSAKTTHDGFGSSIDIDMNWPQVLHFTGNECLTKYEMCQVFAEILDLDISKGMEAQAEAPNSGSVQRPYDTQLATEELQKILGCLPKSTSFKDWWISELTEGPGRTPK